MEEMSYASLAVERTSKGRHMNTTVLIKCVTAVACKVICSIASRGNLQIVNYTFFFALECMGGDLILWYACIIYTYLYICIYACVCVYIYLLRLQKEIRNVSRAIQLLAKLATFGIEYICV